MVSQHRRGRPEFEVCRAVLGCAVISCSGVTGADRESVAGSSSPTSSVADPLDSHPACAFEVAHAQVVATGIPGAGAIAQVGAFLPGGAVHDVFGVYTQAGAVFAPDRLLVATTSNFGAPLGRPNDPPGAILSLDVSAGPIALPPAFAVGGGQASALGGSVQLFSSQSVPFNNPVNTRVTAQLMAVSLPTGISLNNGSGRPWFSNAPGQSGGSGTITVLNPTGVPTAIFAGDETNRDTNTTHGLVSAALGTALITKSPDATEKPVFAAVEADGSIVQVHVAKGVDGLAPPGTITPVDDVNSAVAESTERDAAAREGVVLNWIPRKSLLVADPKANRVVVLDLSDDGALFTVDATHMLTAPELDVPIDLAPTAREVASAGFASNTTLAGGSDIYVLNRGNNTIVRMRLDGRVVAVRAIDADVDHFRVGGIALSADSATLYVTATVPHRGGIVLSLPAFGGSRVSEELGARAAATGAAGAMRLGEALFSLKVTPDEGLGPLFNAQSCEGCHSSPLPGGMGIGPDTTERVVGRIERHGGFDSLEGRGGPVARAHSVRELGVACSLPVGVSRSANVVSVRSTMTLRGNGSIDAIQERDIVANQLQEPEAWRGRANRLADGRIGRFGWKANVPTLVEFVATAFRNEMGVTNPIAPFDEVDGCGANDPEFAIDAIPVSHVTAFLNTLTPAAPTPLCLTSSGAPVFQTVGCASCHTPTLPGQSTQLHLYSDLLLHDMGPGLADGMLQGSASGSEWRTMPLWGVSERAKFLHDGRATTLKAAIAAHGGQASPARDAFAGLDESSRQALLAFLGCI